jgi:pimeloyl-ACP methyl ester carboxylesterase
MGLAPDLVASDTPVLPDQSRAVYPHTTGRLERPGGFVAYEVYGDGEPPIMFVPPWQIAHSRIWKAQIPDFARRHRVIAWDARGNGRSDRPKDPAVLSPRARAADLLAILDVTGTRAAVIVSLSSGAGPSVVVAAEAPERVLGAAFVCPSVPIASPGRSDHVPFEEPLDDDTGWNKENVHFWRRDFRAYLEFFFGEAFNEPHSTKQVEDGIGYGLSTDPETLAATARVTGIDKHAYLELCARISCPVLVIQGTADAITNVDHGTELARAIPGAALVLLTGAGHIPSARDPVRVNLALRDFITRIGADR